MLANSDLKRFYNDTFTDNSLIVWAAQGGNPLLLTECLEQFQKHVMAPPENTSNVANIAEEVNKTLTKLVTLGMITAPDDTLSYTKQYGKVIAELDDFIKKKQQTNPDYCNSLQKISTNLRNITTLIHERIANNLKHTKATPRDIIHHAIVSDSAECLRILSQQLAAGGKPLSVDERIHYVTEAIRQNKHSIIIELINMVPKLEQEDLKIIHMDAQATARTNLLILRQLKGVTFSETALDIIAKKEHQKLGVLQSLGIIISKYTCFIKEVLHLSDKKKQGISIVPSKEDNISNDHSIKDELNKIKDSAPKEEPEAVIKAKTIS